MIRCAAPRLALALALLAALSPLAGCIQHVHLDRGAPGAPQVAQGRITPPGELTPPSDPGERVTVITVGAMFGPGTDVQNTRPPDLAQGENDPGFYMHFGAEITYRTLTLERSHTSTELSRAMKEQPFRPVLGWSLVRIEDSNGVSDPRLGPGYLEWVYERGFLEDAFAPGFAVGGGLAWDLQVPTLGPQASACLMFMMALGAGLCGQAAFFPFRGTDVQMNVLFRGHLELFSSR